MKTHNLDLAASRLTGNAGRLARDEYDKLKTSVLAGELLADALRQELADWTNYSLANLAVDLKWYDHAVKESE